MKYDTRHGGPFDRGSADAYYRRAYSPHYFKAGTYSSEKVVDLTEEELRAYAAGFDEQQASGDFKDWG